MAPYSWLVLDGGCGDEQVGLFVAALTNGVDVPVQGGRDDVVDALLAEEMLLVVGGLQVRDSGTGAVVVPGCCAGLENWRDWTQVPAGDPPWLGHAPDPEIEVLGDRLRVWQDSGPNRHRGRWAGVHVDLPQAALPALLMNVRSDLAGFLVVPADWAERLGLGARGRALAEAIDRDFAITSPLDLGSA
jgi:hypothetical protein